MAFGADGRLYCTVFGQGDIAVIGPDGAVERRIVTEGQNPTNVAGARRRYPALRDRAPAGTDEIHQTDTTALPLYYGGPEPVACEDRAMSILLTYGTSSGSDTARTTSTSMAGCPGWRSPSGGRSGR